MINNAQTNICYQTVVFYRPVQINVCRIPEVRIVHEGHPDQGQPLWKTLPTSGSSSLWGCRASRYLLVNMYTTTSILK